MTIRNKGWLIISAIFAFMWLFNPALANSDLSRYDKNSAEVANEQVMATDDFVAGEVLVGFRPGVNANAVARARKGLRASAKKDFSQIRARLWKLPKGLSVGKAIAILMKNPSVEYAEPNYILRADALPNDPHMSDLWGMHNVGQTGGLIGADIDAVDAWDKLTAESITEPDIVVGIIDTGIDLLHEDLADNIWFNTLEVDGVSGEDDDHNGYVDDVWGWNFYDDDNNPFDDNGHGTHVAGTIGGIGNNGIGVAGVAWSVKLMALKFLDASGRGETDGAIEAVLYAASMGVPITNNSWGGGKKSVTLQNAIGSSNSLFVASAGNWNTSKVQYPAGYSLDNILSVAASDANDEKASFSNYGSRWVDLAAPGVDILSSLPGNEYDYKSGTSMAAPHVTGVAAIVMAEYPGLLPTEVKAYIMDSVDLLSAFEGITVSGGRLNALTAVGGGTTSGDDETAPAAVGDLIYIEGSTTLDAVKLQWTASADDGNDSGSGPAFAYDLRYRTDVDITVDNWDTAIPVDGEPSPQAPGVTESMSVTGLASGTTFHFALIVIDEAGNTSELSNNATASTIVSPWEIGVINDINRIGWWQSIALEPVTEHPAIAYSDTQTDDVLFAQWNGFDWDKAIAAGSGNPGISFVFDPDGNPAISHAYRKVYFSQRNEGGWSTELVDGKGTTYGETSLAYDLNGHPCIAYLGKSSELKISCNYGSGWELQIVESYAFANYISLAFDHAGNPVIAYSDDLDGDNRVDALKYAKGEWDGSSWEWKIEIVDEGTAPVGEFASLVIDPGGMPMLADRADGMVRFFYLDGTEWSKVEVDEGTKVNMAIHSTGTPYISYSAYDPYTVKVAFPVTSGSYDTWEIQTVDNAHATWKTSIAIKGDGRPVVGYTDYNDFLNYILKWAERLEP